MGFELPDGKTARNIQEQVAFLTEKLKDLYAAFNELGIKKIEIVETLPETGEEGILYLLALEDPEEGNYYDEYIWLDNTWEQIGTTQIDLSNYYTKTESDAKYVDLTTAQTITGEKTFTSNLYASQAFYTPTIKLSATGLDWTIKGDILYNQIEIDKGSAVVMKMSDTDIMPRNNQNLGTAAYQWKDFHLSGTIDFGDGAKISKDSSNRIIISYSNTTKIKIGGTGSYVEGFWAPDVDNSYDLGRASARWKNLYLIGDLSDGANSASIADIAALITYAKAQGWIS